VESPPSPNPAAARAAKAKTETPPAPKSKATKDLVRAAGKDEEAPVEKDGYLDQCIGDITRQLMAAPPKHGASVTPIVLAGCKLLIATWEAEAYTKGNDELSEALQRAVAARTILHVCVERHKKREPTDLFVALEIAHLAVEEMRHQVAKAKQEKNIDGAVNLAATTKRLLGLIAEGEKLCK
jgi:aspartate/tyrosine/aromatic aminotransferase